MATPPKPKPTINGTGKHAPPRGRPFQPGQSGNPGGRPAVMAEVQDLARQNSEVAMAALVEIARGGKSESARVAAAVAILDRGYGKPAQFIEANLRQQSFHDISDDQLMAIALSAGTPDEAESHNSDVISNLTSETLQ